MTAIINDQTTNLGIQYKLKKHSFYVQIWNKL